MADSKVCAWIFIAGRLQLIIMTSRLTSMTDDWRNSKDICLRTDLKRQTFYASSMALSLTLVSSLNLPRG